MAEVKSEKNVEREFVIPLRSKFMHVARYKKTPKAIKTIKEFIARHMRIYDKDLNKIKVDKHVNEFMWARGIKNPPQKIKVKAIKDSKGLVRVELVEYPDKLKFKKLREEKQSKDALAAIDKKKTLKDKVQEQVKGSFQGSNKAEEAQSHEEKSKESKTENKTEKADKNQDGVKDKKELKEKQESVKEEGEKMEKDMAKKEKHTTKGKPMKDKLGEKKEYNQTSQHK